MVECAEECSPDALLMAASSLLRASQCKIEVCSLYTRIHRPDIKADGERGCHAATEAPAPVRAPLLVAGARVRAADGRRWAIGCVSRLLIGPIFDRVLNPGAQTRTMELFKIPGTDRIILLQQVVPSYFQNPWTVVAFALVASTILKGLFDYAGTYLVNYAGFGLITDLRDDLYNSILRRSAGFSRSNTTGTLLSTIINDIERVQYAMSRRARGVPAAGLYFDLYCRRRGGTGRQACVGFAALYSHYYFLRRQNRTPRCEARPVAAGQAGGNSEHPARNDQRQSDCRSVRNGVVGRWRGSARRARRLFRANLRSVAAAAISSPLMDVFGAIAIALLLLLGRGRINHRNVHRWNFSCLYHRRIQTVRSRSGNSRSSTTISSRRSVPHLRFSASWIPKTTYARNPELFRYRHSQKCRARTRLLLCTKAPTMGAREVLHDIDLSVTAGEVIAVVGSSGAGKSTLVHLIPRFFDVTSGRLLIDGRDVRDVTLSSLRKQIGIVTQETVLFNDTVRNNIAYGQPHVSAKEVEAAARAALAHDFIMELPSGYETVIGERGVRLSGGERQRMAIARAILKNSSHLDSR